MKASQKLLTGLVLFAIPLESRAQERLYQVFESLTIESISSCGDIDGDGIPEIITGLPSYSSSTGKINVRSGANGNLIAEYLGENSSGYFGGSVAGSADLNNDSIPDLIVGAEYYDSVTIDGGRVYALSGLDGTVLWSVDGENQSDYLGSAVDTIQDIDSDGVDDVIAGAPGWNNDALGFSDVGKVYVYSGATGSLIHAWYGDGQGDNFGRSVAGLGDLDNDGTCDIAVGAPYDDNIYKRSGSARVFSGATGSILIFAINGESANAKFGWSLDSVDDLNADNVPDLLVGAPEHSSSAITECGAVYAISGSDGSVIHRSLGTFENGYPDRLGRTISSIGDINLDGVEDYLTGASNARHPDASTGLYGYALAISGSSGSGLSNRIWSESSSYNNNGRLVAGLGDVDLDGIPDYISCTSNRLIVYAGNPFLGESYCAVNGNTNGTVAIIGATGTSSIAANDLNLQVSGAVPNQFGIFYYGTGRTQIAFGYGWRCAGAPTRRLDVLNTDASGNAQYLLDNTNNSGVPPALQIAEETTFNFQFWYRDPAAGGPAFNLSNAAEITFYP